ncbi:MAG: hypothetical protein KC996_07750 [Phycisphaerales bacterium]|nr:hypothetical protein [Phycisphaerales bacterium]
MSTNDLSRFFKEARNLDVHIGHSPLQAGASNGCFYFIPSRDLARVPKADCASCCISFLSILCRIVEDAYNNFGWSIDPQVRYTKQEFENPGMSIEDAEEDLGYPRGWTYVSGPWNEEVRWKLLRREAGIYRPQNLFDMYKDKEDVYKSSPDLFVSCYRDALGAEQAEDDWVTFGEDQIFA